MLINKNICNKYIYILKLKYRNLKVVAPIGNAYTKKLFKNIQLLVVYFHVHIITIVANNFRTKYVKV